MPEIIKSKLCKFREADVRHIEMIQLRYGFHEEMAAIRFALHSVAAEIDLPKRKSRKPKQGA